MSQDTDIEIRERKNRVEEEIRMILDQVVPVMNEVGRYMQIEAGDVLLRSTVASMLDYEWLRLGGVAHEGIPAYMDISAKRNGANQPFVAEGEDDVVHDFQDWSSLRVGTILTPGGIVIGDNVRANNLKIGGNYTKNGEPNATDPLVVLDLLKLLSSSLGCGSIGERNE